MEREKIGQKLINKLCYILRKKLVLDSKACELIINATVVNNNPDKLRMDTF